MCVFHSLRSTFDRRPVRRDSCWAGLASGECNRTDPTGRTEGLQSCWSWAPRRPPRDLTVGLLNLSTPAAATDPSDSTAPWAPEQLTGYGPRVECEETIAPAGRGLIARGSHRPTEPNVDM